MHATTRNVGLSAFLPPLLTCAGCFTVDLAKEPPTKTRYLFDVAMPELVADPPKGLHPILLVEQVHALSPYNARPFVYRKGRDVYAPDFYHEFLVSPGLQLGQLTRSWLRAAGTFPNVIASDSALVADATLSLDLLDLHGDFREPQAPRAVLSVRAALLSRGTADVEPVAEHQKDYRQSIPITEASPQALIRGWSEALAQVLEDLAKDLIPFGKN